MFNPEQKAQVEKQIEAYDKKVGVGLVRIPVDSAGLELEVDAFVANPEIMNSGIQVAEHLAEHPELVEKKVVTDMGTGCGIIGVEAARLHATKVFMADIDERAVRNAAKNVARHNLGDVCDVFQSDLFSNWGNHPLSDVQIFNHPFFSEQPVTGKEWTRMMLGGTELIKRYLTEAPHYSTPDAKYIMPWLTLANSTDDREDNDPGRVAPQLGFEIVNAAEQQPVSQGLQRSVFKIYEFRKK